MDEGRAYQGPLVWLCGAFQPTEGAPSEFTCRCSLPADHGNRHEAWLYQRMLASWPRLGAEEDGR